MNKLSRLILVSLTALLLTAGLSRAAATAPVATKDSITVNDLPPPYDPDATVTVNDLPPPYDPDATVTVNDLPPPYDPDATAR